MTHQKANRIAWLGWGLSILLGFTLVLTWRNPNIPGHGFGAIGAEFGLIGLLWIWLRSDLRAANLAMDGSMSGFFTGSWLIFVILAFGRGKPSLWGMVALLSLIVVFCSFFFRKELRTQPLPESESDVEPDIPEPIQARYGVRTWPEVEAQLMRLTEEERQAEVAFVEGYYERFFSETREEVARIERSHKRMMRWAYVSFAVSTVVFMIQLSR